MTSILPDTIASAQELSQLIDEVKEYARWYMHESIKRRVSNKRSNGSNEPALSAAASEVIRSLNKSGELRRQDFEQLTKQLENFLAHASVVQFTLAAPVTGDVKQKLVGWCRKNLTDDTLVTFHHNSTLLGGMVMQYKSRVFDWSFRRQILDNARAFPKELQNV